MKFNREAATFSFVVICQDFEAITCAKDGRKESQIGLVKIRPLRPGHVNESGRHRD